MAIDLRAHRGLTKTEDGCSSGQSMKRKVLRLLLISLVLFSIKINFGQIELSDFTTAIAYTSISSSSSEADDVPIREVEWKAALEFYKTLESFDVADVWREKGGDNFHIPQSQVDRIEKTYHTAAEILLRSFPPLKKYSLLVVDIDCSNIIYSDALTGRVDPNEKIIVDINLFGWDAD